MEQNLSSVIIKDLHLIRNDINSTLEQIEKKLFTQIQT